MKEEGGEILHVRGSRKIYFLVYLMIVVLFLSLAVVKLTGKEINNLTWKLVIGFAIACLIFTEIHRLGSWYEVNPNALVVSKGLLSRTTRRVDLVSVSDADTRQHVWQRFLNYGDVRARLFSKESTVLIKNVDNPEKFIDFLEKSMNRKKAGEGSPI